MKNMKTFKQRFHDL